MPVYMDVWMCVMAVNSQHCDTTHFFIRTEPPMLLVPHDQNHVSVIFIIVAHRGRILQIVPPLARLQQQRVADTRTNGCRRNSSHRAGVMLTRMEDDGDARERYVHDP
jgi:hypothetical protein